MCAAIPLPFVSTVHTSFMKPFAFMPTGVSSRTASLSMSPDDASGARGRGVHYTTSDMSRHEKKRKGWRGEQCSGRLSEPVAHDGTPLHDDAHDDSMQNDAHLQSVRKIASTGRSNVQAAR